MVVVVVVVVLSLLLLSLLLLLLLLLLLSLLYFQVTLESDLEVEISYYNDKFATWEPFLEPEITDGESVKWGLQLKVPYSCSYCAAIQTSSILRLLFSDFFLPSNPGYKPFC